MKQWWVGVLGVCLMAAAGANSQGIRVSGDADLNLVALTEQTLTEATTITLQPRDPGNPAEAFSDAWPEHCLLSVQATPAGTGFDLVPGKMVCVTEDRRILEGTPEARIFELGQCQSEDTQSCGGYRIQAGETGRLELSAPFELTPQPRNLSQ